MIFLDVDPNVVKPGWTPLIITILLAAAIALLMVSMRRQMRKIRVPYRDEVDEAGSAEPDAGSERRPTEPADGSTPPSAPTRGS